MPSPSASLSYSLGSTNFFCCSSLGEPRPFFLCQLLPPSSASFPWQPLCSSSLSRPPGSASPQTVEHRPATRHQKRLPIPLLVQENQDSGKWSSWVVRPRR